MAQAAPTVAEIFSDLYSRDADRVIDAMWAIFRLRDADALDTLAAALPGIERATAGLDLGGMVHSNDDTLAFALGKLRHHRDRAGCLCRLYPGHLLYDPEVEAEAGNVRILETRHVEKWLDSYSCECTQCGTLFAVEYGEQHVSWWKWVVAGPR